MKQKNSSLLLLFEFSFFRGFQVKHHMQTLCNFQITVLKKGKKSIKMLWCTDN